MTPTAEQIPRRLVVCDLKFPKTVGSESPAPATPLALPLQLTGIIVRLLTKLR